MDAGMVKMNMQTNMIEANRFAVIMFGVSMLPELRRMDWADLKELLMQVSDIINELPVWMELGPKEKARLKFDRWHGGEQLSGWQVISLMVFGIYVLCGESEHVASPLLEVWPIREAIALAPKVH